MAQPDLASWSKHEVLTEQLVSMIPIACSHLFTDLLSAAINDRSDVKQPAFQIDLFQIRTGGKTLRSSNRSRCRFPYFMARVVVKARKHLNFRHPHPTYSSGIAKLIDQDKSNHKRTPYSSTKSTQDSRLIGTSYATVGISMTSTLTPTTLSLAQIPMFDARG